jgi:exo-beta-1,3-glucanase (GH17 family)
MRWFTLPVLLGLSLLVLAGWWLANRPVDPAPGVRVDKFASLSFSAYRAWESPLTDHFPTMAEADADMALLAPVTRAVRTYAAVEGSLDTAALAQKHGVKLWQGIWLGADRAKNDIEMARGIALARRYPGTIERVIVGNEVLLRRDLPPEELIADIDKVKAAVKQPVAYADVWDFWKQFPQVAPHVDVMLIHLLPYWEDVPTGIDRAVAHVGDAYAEMKRLFPGSKIAIGETGWPSRGRERADAVPSRVNETRFLREFIALSQREHFDYNFIEAFDQAWKYQSEGVVGASWGIFDSDRAEKIPLRGAVTENPAWLRYAGLSVGIGLILAMCGCFRVPPGSFRTHMAVLGAAMALGSACAWGRSIAGPEQFDRHVALAATVNLCASLLLSGLAIRRLAGGLPAAPARTGADATRRVQGLHPFRLHGVFEDTLFVFSWAAAVLQMLLVFDPRYRDFPLPTFIVPILVTAGRILARDLPLAGGGREEAMLGAALVAGAVASAIQEGRLNGQSLAWNACALLRAVPPLLRFSRSRR